MLTQNLIFDNMAVISEVVLNIILRTAVMRLYAVQLVENARSHHVVKELRVDAIFLSVPKAVYQPHISENLGIRGGVLGLGELVLDHAQERRNA